MLTKLLARVLVLIGWHTPTLLLCWLLLHWWGIDSYPLITACVVAVYLLFYGIAKAVSFWAAINLPYAPPNVWLNVHRFAGANGFADDKLYITTTTEQTEPNASAMRLCGRTVVTIHHQLINKLTEPQITALAVHELGHVHHRHHLKLLAMFVLAWALRIISLLFFMQYAAGWPLLLFIPAVFILNQATYRLYLNAINQQRHQYEYQADVYAARHGHGAALITALVSMGLYNATPTHPATTDRLQALHKLAGL